MMTGGRDREYPFLLFFYKYFLKNISLSYLHLLIHTRLVVIVGKLSEENRLSLRRL